MLKQSIELHRTGRYAEADEGYRVWLAEHPNDIEALYMYGILRRELGAYDEGEALMLRAHELAPDRIDIIIGLGNVCFEKRDFAGACRRYEHALSFDPNQAIVHAGLGQALLMLGETSRAEQHFHMALRLADSPAAHAGLGSIALERADAETALKQLTRAAELAPGDPQIQFLLGRAFTQRGTPAFAEQAYGNALRLNANLHPARHMLAQLLLEGGRADEAEPHFRTLAEHPSFGPIGVLGLADVARARGDLNAAVEGYRAALAASPGQAQIVVPLAWCLTELGRRDEAMAAYDQFLQRHPNDRTVRAARAEVNAAIGRPAEAITEWTVLAEQDPDDLQAQIRLAQLHERQGEYPAALAAAERVIALKPDEPGAILVRIRARLRDGDDAGARELLEAWNSRPLSEGSRRQCLNYLGQVHDHAGDYAQAARAFAQAQHGAPSALHPLSRTVPAELDAALAAPAKPAWAEAPVLLLGAPGSGVERIAALLADQPDLVVLRDRSGRWQRDDDFASPQFEAYRGELDEATIDAIRARYLAPLRRAGIGADATVVDWLPRWDARLLALLRQAMPGTRLIVVERDPRDALLNWLAFGWLPGIGCSDVAAAARWLARAQRHLQHGAGLDDPRRLHVDADAVLADPATGGAGLSAFLGLGGLLRRGPELAQADQWPGGLPSRFPAGHWRHYASVLAEPFAQAAGGDAAA